MRNDFYCGVKNDPFKRRRGNKKECANADMIKYYGLHPVDKNIIDNAKSKMKIEKQINRLLVKIASINGTILNLKNKMIYAKNDKDKDKIIKEYNNVYKKKQNFIKKKETLKKEYADISKP